jgi:hypothetical protein
MASTELSSLKLPASYQADRAEVFPGIESFRWFLRQHRPRLIKAGALLTIGGRHLVDPARFDQVVVVVGREAAANRVKAA